MNAAIDGELFGSPAGVLTHVATAERWYLDKLGLAFPRAEMPTGVLRMLEYSRQHTLRVLPRLTDDERVTLHRGEFWSGRKIARRMLWHERVHTWHLERLISNDA